MRSCIVYLYRRIILIDSYSWSIFHIYNGSFSIPIHSVEIYFSNSCKLIMCGLIQGSYQLIFRAWLLDEIEEM